MLVAVAAILLAGCGPASEPPTKAPVAVVQASAPVAEEPQTVRLGGEATDRPVTFQEVFATLYHNLGVPLQSRRLFDFRGRPQYLVDPDVKPIMELVG